MLEFKKIHQAYKFCYGKIYGDEYSRTKSSGIVFI